MPTPPARRCLSCTEEMDAGYCQACFDQQARHLHRPGYGGAQRHHCAECGQWREQGDGQCECWRDRR